MSVISKKDTGFHTLHETFPHFVKFVIYTKNIYRKQNTCMNWKYFMNVGLKRSVNIDFNYKAYFRSINSSSLLQILNVTQTMTFHTLNTTTQKTRCILCPSRLECLLWTFWHLPLYHSKANKFICLLYYFTFII